MTSRALIAWSSRLPLVSRAAAWFANRRYDAWQQRNPDRDFSQFYVDDVLAKIAKGSAHPTLGGRGWARSTRQHCDWDRETFAARGRDQWDYYARAMGIVPSARCVDFGCGSLRIGQHAIRSQDAGCYWGLDVTDDFIRTGIGMLDPAVVEQKKPRLGVIDNDTLSQVRAWKPDGLFANAVVQHIPEGELATFFERIATIMAPGSVAAITFIASPEVKRVKAMSWAYPPDLLKAKVHYADRELMVDALRIAGEDAKAFSDPRWLLRIFRPALSTQH